MTKALVVFSGGQDSTTCLLKALSTYDEVRAVSFFYSQKHATEIVRASEICAELGVPLETIDLTNVFAGVQNCALINSNLDIKQGEKYPNTFVDGRNHIFLSTACIIAKQQGIHDVITGVCQTDYSGYPDCRRVFVDSLEQTLSLAMDYKFNIITPLMYLNKKETWKMADDLGYLDFVKTKTHTCYNGVPGGCHECPACKLREKGLQEYLTEKEGAHYEQNI